MSIEKLSGIFTVFIRNWVVLYLILFDILNVIRYFTIILNEINIFNINYYLIVFLFILFNYVLIRIVFV